MTTIGKRFAWIIEDTGLTVNAFAKSIGKSHTYVSNIIEDRNKPGYEVLELVCEHYPEISTKWLLTGDGEPKVTSKTSELPSATYLMDHLSRLEEQFARLLNQLETKDQQIQFKDRHIERLMDLLGKLEGVSIEPVCARESHSKKGVPTPFFMPFKRKFGYTPSSLMVAGSF
jgi:transcriptional regulator with XRE-family HTH domain